LQQQADDDKKHADLRAYGSKHSFLPLLMYYSADCALLMQERSEEAILADAKALVCSRHVFLSVQKVDQTNKYA
jgi:hypothetical protein